MVEFNQSGKAGGRLLELGKFIAHFKKSLAILAREPIGGDCSCGGLEKST
jgi:hypothetical protein